MKNIMSIILLQLLFLVDSCCVGSSQNSMYHPIDSISTNYSQSNVAYYGIRLWPKENSRGEVKKGNVENRIFRVLDMGDTLTIVSDDSRFFNNNIYSIATKKRAREIYRGYRLDFDEEIPIRFCATSLSDTIIYEKAPIKSASYQLTKGILRSDLAIGMVIKEGMTIDSLIKDIELNNSSFSNRLSKYKHVAIIHPMAVRSNFVNKKIEVGPQKGFGDFTMLLLTIDNHKISSIEFTDFGKERMTDGLSVEEYLNFI